MKKILKLSILFLSLNSFSQNFVSVNYTQISSNLIFTNSGGQRDNTIKATFNSAYAVNYQKCTKSGFFLRGEFGYKAFGAISNYNTELLSWNLKYIDVNIGAGYILNKFKFKPYLGASFYGAYLFSATQMIGVNYYDMLKSNTIKNNDFGINAFVGIIHSVSEFASVYIEVADTRGFNQLETAPGQKLYNTAVSVRLGVSFLIDKDDNKYNFMFKK
jgi:hypothetical protein